MIYLAKDSNKYDIIEKYTINVTENIEQLQITPDIAENQVFYATDITKLPVPTASGGSGKLDISYEYTFNGAKITPDTDGNYIFEDSGVLKLTAEVTDYLGNSIDDEFTYIVGGKSMIKLAYAIPQRLQAGASFVLPDFTAFTREMAMCASLDKKITVNGK